MSTVETVAWYAKWMDVETANVSKRVVDNWIGSDGDGEAIQTLPLVLRSDYEAAEARAQQLEAENQREMSMVANLSVECGRLKQQVQQAEQALRNVLELIDTQWLVRNTGWDLDPDWASKLVHPLRKLAAARAIVK